MHRRALLLVVLSGVLLLTACGKKGDPLPPIRLIPAETRDLSIHQQGNLLIFRMQYPQSTAAGEVLPGLDEVEVWRLEAPLPDPSRPPEIDPRLFVAEAEKLFGLRGPELEAAVTGDRIETRMPAPPAREAVLDVFAIRTLSSTGEASAVSNLVSLVLAPGAPPPQNAQVEATADGVLVTWTPPDWTVLGYNLYRRPSTERAFGEPLARIPPQADRHLDDTAVFGQRYIYTLRAIKAEDPLVESDAAAESEIDFQDRFAPPAPTEVVALGESASARLVWEASPAADTAGYRIYRRDPGADFRRVNERPVAQPEFLDTGLAGGLRYEYRVTAVDQVGNESEPSTTVDVVVE